MSGSRRTGGAIRRPRLPGWGAGMVLLAGLAVMGAAPPGQAQQPDPAESQQDAGAPAALGPSGRPLPRFVSLRSNEVNMRTGPGMRYPVAWVYRRRGLPLEVLRETERWRQVRDPDGAEGWMHTSMLTNSERRAIIRAETSRILLRRPDALSDGIAEVEPGVLVKVLQCPRDGAHCRVEAGRFQGWLERTALWGVYPGEYVD